MESIVQWGILGCGKIAIKLATGLQSSPNSRLLATGSRSIEKARKFAKEYGAERSYGSYEELVNDADIDAIYVATPHPMHREHSILALRAGKAVLCEKPFAMNTAEALEMVSVAREEGRFLMEAMWSRFLPLIRKTREMVQSGVIGELRMLQADFGFRTAPDPTSRLFDPNLGGGGLLDVGIYPISLASFLFGRQPSRIATLAEIGDTGVDEQAGILFGYPDGGLALLATGVRTTTSHEATIMGTDGYIRLHGPWWRGAAGMTLNLQGKEPESIDIPLDGNGYNYEVDEVSGCVLSGKTESGHMSLDESLAVIKTMDIVRSEWGLRYPMEDVR
jgi:dihydrodiol dehydrogenase / D-xylose 1-dehydrogenase (NADP)